MFLKVKFDYFLFSNFYICLDYSCVMFCGLEFLGKDFGKICFYGLKLIY